MPTIELDLETALQDNYLGPLLVRQMFEENLTLESTPTPAEAQRYVESVEGACQLLDYFYATDRSLAAVDLIERSLALIERSAPHLESLQEVADDVLGYHAGNLLTLHRRACRRAGLGGPGLAARLVQLELASATGHFADSLWRYRELLGPQAVAIYRGVVEPLWAELPLLRPDSPPAPFDDRAHNLDRMLHLIFLLVDDHEGRVRVKSRALTDACHYLFLARLCQRAERPEQAREWALAGLEHYPDDYALRLFAGHRVDREPTPLEQLTLAAADYHDFRYEEDEDDE